VAWRQGNLAGSPILKLCLFIDCLHLSGLATGWVLGRAWPGSFGDHHSACAPGREISRLLGSFAADALPPNWKLARGLPQVCKPAPFTRPDAVDPKSLVSRQLPWRSLGSSGDAARQPLVPRWGCFEGKLGVNLCVH
jgi:hypothetical protein